MCVRCDFHEYERNLTAITVCIPCIAITLHSFHLLPQATTAMKDILEGLISLIGEHYKLCPLSSINRLVFKIAMT